MRFRGLMVIFALALLVAAPAGGRVLDVGFLDDKPGDGSPDITRIRVGSNATAVTFSSTSRTRRHSPRVRVSWSSLTRT